MYQIARFSVLAMAIGLVGCGKGDDAPAFANVSGAVSYGGEPIDKGTITFSTDGRAPTSMDIVNGQYTGQAMVGSNKVAISSFRKAAKERKLPETAEKQVTAYSAMNKGGGGGGSPQSDLSMEDFIPEEYGRGTKQIRVVEAGGANKFDFNIPKK
jgi:hypothetical protein